jgi:hypothetical protein
MDSGASAVSAQLHPPLRASARRGSSFGPRASLSHRGDPSLVTKSPNSSSKSPWRATAGVLCMEFRGRLTDRRLQRLDRRLQRLPPAVFETAPLDPESRSRAVSSGRRAGAGSAASEAGSIES